MRFSAERLLANDYLLGRFHLGTSALVPWHKQRMLAQNKQFLKRAWRPVTLAAASAVLAVVAAGEHRAAEPKVIVLGFNGADPARTTRFIEEGHLPNLQRPSRQGHLTGVWPR